MSVQSRSIIAIGIIVASVALALSMRRSIAEHFGALELAKE